jgi:hypothetical protein
MNSKSHTNSLFKRLWLYFLNDIAMPYSFSSVARVWEPGAKTTGRIAKKFVFS